MLISVIVPTRGKAHLVRRCLEHLQRSRPPAGDRLEVLVLEQGGEDSRPIVEGAVAAGATWPMRWMPSEPHWSYSEINNAGADACAGDALLLLNNDCFVDEDCVAQLAAAMSREDRTGVVGAKLRFEDGRLQHIGISIVGDGQPSHTAHRAPDDGTTTGADSDTSPDAVTFACALLRRRCWQEVGGLDPAYHFNYEDVDFCLAARERGWAIAYAHRARAMHLESASLDDRNTWDHTKRRNFGIYSDKWIRSGRLATVLGRTIRPDPPPTPGEAARTQAPLRRRGPLARALRQAWRALLGRR